MSGDAGVVSVAIPVRNGGAVFEAVLRAVRRQVVPAGREVEIVVVDSSSSDGSAAAARAHGARVVEIAAAEFSHGGTRNRLMELARGAHVAFLTHDAEPAHERWLAELLAGFDAAPDVALVAGPYLPRPDATPMVRRELEEWFARLAPLERAAPGERPDPGPRFFFSDANGAVARWAWEQVPYRPVPYAEDRVLAAEMLARGWARAYCPGAAALHSHAYGTLELGRRAFDEARALREVYGHLAPADPRTLALDAARRAAGDRRWLRARGARGPRLAAWTVRAAGHHAVRGAGAALGARADRLPPALRRACSLERRAGFEPLPWPVV
ncbi:MAG TPA: glycosyltransferase family A protein [Solirubrobacteraceae bacterium]